MGGESGLLTDDVHQAAGGILDISDGFCQVFQTMVPWSAKRQSERLYSGQWEKRIGTLFWIP